MSELDSLSHKITSYGILPFQDNVKARESLVSPISIKLIQQFIGMVNYYHRFILGLAQVLIPIHSHLASLVIRSEILF